MPGRLAWCATLIQVNASIRRWRKFLWQEYPMATVEITYFSDMLCIWAYISQARLNAISAKFGEIVRIQHRFCSVFGDTAQKINSRWQDKKGVTPDSIRI